MPVVFAFLLSCGLSYVLLGALLVALLVARPAAGQDARWTAHTSMRQVTDLAVSDEAVWTATTGGIFRFVVATGELSTYTASEGLFSVQTGAVTHDPVRNVVWIGYRNGVLDRLDPVSGVVRSFRDIERAGRFSSREINKIVVRGDSVYVATSFGVVVFDPVKNEVRDTYSQLGSLSAGIPVFDLYVGPGPTGETLWLATDDGVARAPMDAVNLKDPSVWTVEATGLPGRALRAIARFDGRIYVGTTRDLARRRDDGTYEAVGWTNNGVYDLDVLSDRLVGIGRFNPFVMVPGGQIATVHIEGYQDPVGSALGPDGNVWIGDLQGGLIAIEPPEVSQQNAEIVRAGVYPAGPYDNLFTDLVVDGEGSLWAAGILDPQAGFYRFDPPDEWTNYIRRFMPELGTANSFERIHVDERGHAWAGSAGHALAEVTAEGEIRRWDHTNSSIRPASGTESFVLIGGIAHDGDGKVWVTNRAAPVPLHVYDPGSGAWTGIPRVECGGFTTTGVTFDRIFIDTFGQKWIVVVDLANLRRRLGLLVLDVNGTPADLGDDACNFYASEGSGGQGLPGTAVTSVVEDRDGLVWIGTEKGLAFVINSGIVAQDASAVPIWPQFADRTQGTFLLNGIQINDLAVDPANRLWVATNQGVSVVQQVEGGYEIAEQFTSRNSPLFSDNVVSVAVDPTSGRVYMATDQGLISFESDAIAASEQVQDLKVYPNPVRIEDGEAASIFIEGLVESTELRIVTLTGEVVARLQTRGGRARWDGRDESDRLVPSGVYLVIAVGEGGEGTAYGKVAVIR